MTTKTRKAPTVAQLVAHQATDCLAALKIYRIASAKNDALFWRIQRAATKAGVADNPFGEKYRQIEKQSDKAETYAALCASGDRLRKGLARLSRLHSRTVGDCASKATVVAALVSFGDSIHAAGLEKTDHALLDSLTADLRRIAAKKGGGA